MSPNVIQFYDAWEYRDHLLIQMEFCENGNLQHFLELFGSVNGSLEEERIWKMTAEIANAIVFLHTHGVLHLDIKPANIFLTARGGLKLGDFGLSSRWPRVDQLTILRGAAVGYHETLFRPSGLTAIAAERRSRTSSDQEEDLEREGDREYIAPEIMSGRYGTAADIFALGLIALEASVNVVLPDNGEEWHHLRSDNFSCVDMSHLTDELVGLIKALMRADPDQRITTAELAEHPVISLLHQLREVGIKRESRSDSSADATSAEMPAIVEEDEEHSVGFDGHPCVPADGIWRSARGALLPEAPGFLDFILGDESPSLTFATEDDGAQPMDIDS